MDTTDKELIWVDKEFAKRYTEIQSAAGKREAFEAYIKTVTAKSQEEFRVNFESLEEDVAIYTGLMLKVKQAFEKAKNEQLTASYALWEKFDEELPKTSNKINILLDKIKPLEEKLKELKDLVSHINLWDVEKLIKTVETLSSLYGENKDMVKFLIDNYKKE